MTPATVWPQLIVLTDTERGPVERWLCQVESLLALARPSSVEVILRDRQLPIRERRRLGDRLRALTRRHEQSLGVNDRLDLAVLLDADAVHLSEASVSVDDAREFGLRYGRRWRVSGACHAPERFRAATEDALLLSPIMEARKGRPPLGLSAVARAMSMQRERSRELARCRLYALGGVTSQNARALLDAGADGVALIGELFDPDAPKALARALGIER
jgi:thiamine-phosphate pyrophosphorylase